MNAFVTIDAKPEPMSIDPARTAVIVVDMQNDFGTEGGMFARAGIDIAPIRKAIEPTKAVLTAARRAGVNVVYLKMERSEEHTSELQSRVDLVCRLLLEKKKKKKKVVS